MRVLTGPRRALNWVGFSPDGRELAAHGLGPLRVWRDGRGRDAVAGTVAAMAYTPDGRWLVCDSYRLVHDGAGYRTDADSGLFAHDRRADRPPARLPADGLLAVADDWVVGRADGNTHTVGFRLGEPPATAAWALPHPTAAAVPLPGRRVATREGEAVRIRAADTGELLAEGRAPADGYQLVAAPDGGRVVLSSGTRVYVWPADALAHKPAAVSLGRRRVWGLTWHPSGAYLLGVGVGGLVKRLDAATWGVTDDSGWPGGKATAVAVAPDGLTAAVGTSQGRVVVFDLD